MDEAEHPSAAPDRLPLSSRLLIKRDGGGGRALRGAEGEARGGVGEGAVEGNLCETRLLLCGDCGLHLEELQSDGGRIERVKVGEFGYKMRNVM